MLDKWVYDLKVKVTLSVDIRRVLVGLYKLMNPGEKRVAEALVQGCSLPRLVLGFHSPHLVEHVRDIFNALLKRNRVMPLPVVPQGFYGLRINSLRWSEEKLGLKYGESLFSYPWVDVLKPQVIMEVSLSPLRGLYPPATKVLAFHGLACMGFGKDPRLVRYLEDYDYLFLSGPLHKEAVIKAHGRYGGRLPELVEVGYWRGDRLLEKQRLWDKRSYLAHWGLEERPTVLYAPTWGPFSSAKDWLGKVVEACRVLDFNLLLRLHPLMLAGKVKFEKGGKDWARFLEELCREYSKARVVKDGDVDEAFLTADVLVTDVSSVAMDFFIMGKPVVFLPAPGFFGLYGEDFPIVRVRRGREVGDQAQLVRRLKEGVKNPGSFEVPIETLVYNPGRALGIAVDFLEEVAGG